MGSRMAPAGDIDILECHVGPLCPLPEVPRVGKRAVWPLGKDVGLACTAWPEVLTSLLQSSLVKREGIYPGG